MMTIDTTGETEWLVIEGEDGLTYVPMTVLTPGELSLLGFECRGEVPKLGITRAELFARFEKYYDGLRIDGVNTVIGWGVRWTAPGYLDCTPWEVFDSPVAMQARADELAAESDEGGE